ncbi:hypothetical protein DOTSEDRAFT_54772 [Dothistroma septosporum NZE10]|uniref:Sugar phosphate transporter domain-containing protein n=1 Tax=Dothistroma septosporum (strain NZE10 / CBS 128990) TaxID=675120 RepID=N1PJV0_DOTSN|nr:hypothetical protein DOTSEDRAFT_54772 [Dothistroma septosporum NZE10]
METTTSPPTHARRRSESLLLGTAANSNRTGHGHRSQAGERGGYSEDRSGSEASVGTLSDDLELDEMRASEEELGDDAERGLTNTERKKRRRRRRQHTKPDERIARTPSDKEAEEGIAKAAMMRHIIVNALLIALWYTFSISISVYNKWMFSSENLDFHFPLFTTSIHMLVQFSAAAVTIWFLPRFRPWNANELQDPHCSGYSRVQNDENDTDTITQAPRTKKPLMSRSFYLTRIAPCGTATALDIGLGNFSLRFITLTFYTMCKSSVLAFVLLFAFIFKLENPTWKLCMVITTMTAGVIMMVSGEAAFSALGFILVMTASFCSGFRWSLSQILLLRNPATSNPFSSIFFLTPVMFLILFLLALPIEGPKQVLAGLATLGEQKGYFLGALIMLFPGILAFMMVAAEFALLQRSSVVTLSVCGIFKEVLTISAASLTFGDELSPINISGLVVTITSIAAYNWVKYDKMKRDAKSEAHQVIEDDGLSGGVPPGKASSALERDGAFVIGRDGVSTNGGLLRHSSSLAAHPVEPGGQHGIANGSLADSKSHSPLKRPEDLE